MLPIALLLAPLLASAAAAPASSGTRAASAPAAAAPASAAPPTAAPATPETAAGPRALSIEEALGDLDRQNLTLAQARARAEEARGLERQALAAALPTLGVTGSYTLNSDEVRAPIGELVAAVNPAAPPQPDLLIQPRHLLSVTGTARVPLVAPSAWADVAASRSARRAADASADAVRLGIREALLRAAWGAVSGEEIVAASERAVASAGEQVRLAQRALAAGTGVPLSVLQAQTESVKRESDLVRARADLDRARLAVGVVLGRAEPVRIALPPPRSPPLLDPRALSEEAASRRPELRATASQVESNERQRTSAWLRLSPQLSVSASAFAQSEPLPTGKEQGWRFTADLSWQLYDGGFRYGRVRQAEGAVAEARAAAEAQRVSVAQEVQDSARDVGYQSEVGLADARARLGVALAALDRAAGRS